jgi:hypothetical protein
VVAGDVGRQSSAKSAIPPILQVNAGLMGSWLLLLTQATRMATGRRGHHTQLGMIAAMLVHAFVITVLLKGEIVPLATNIMFRSASASSSRSSSQSPCRRSCGTSIAAASISGPVSFGLRW